MRKAGTSVFRMGTRVLLIEADASVAIALKKALEAEGYGTVLVTRGDEGLARAKGEPFDVVITAFKVSGLSGLEVVRQLHLAKRQLPIIMMTAFGTTDSAIEAIRHGAFDYITKPFEIPALLTVVAQAVARGQPVSGNVYLAQPFHGKSRIVGNGPAMQKLYKEIGRAARTSLNVLICAETSMPCVGEKFFCW